MAAASTFIHLNLHSEYSLVDGTIRIKPLAAQARELGMPAVALTDQSNLFAAVKFYRAALAQGIKPIIGSDIWVENPEDARAPFHLLLLCQNQQGYLNLTELISQAYVDGQATGVPQVKYEWIAEKSAGLIALSGAQQGDIADALLQNNEKLAKTRLAFWQQTFPDRFYIELQRLGRTDEEQYIEQAIELAIARDLPVVATNGTRFLKQDDFEAHEARVCIHEGYTLEDPRRPKNYSGQQYLRSPAEMSALFADIPEAISNTIEIAKRCNVQLKLGDVCLPNFPIPEGMTIDSYLRKQSQDGLAQRFENNIELSEDSKYGKEDYDKRLERELDVIISMGFPGYFLIVADFIAWAKANGIPVGPGRGSGAGSLVAYCLGITDLDPIHHELLFERFLNPERVSMPDFDIDFCMDKRDLVIDYVANKYGRDSVSQIITYGTMAAKAVVRDVGRVLGFPYGFVDKLAKLIPFEIGMTLTKALEQEEMLSERYRQEEDVQTLLNLALSLEGVVRNAGKHAGGVVIAPTKLTDFAALYCEQGGVNLVTQFDKDDIEAVGLVKFDFLGLRTLTIIDWAVQAVNERHRREGKALIDINLIPLDDEASFDLLKDCNTTAVFQLESRGMKDLIKRLQPDCFEEITALVALFRPGPLQSGMVDDFIDRKHGRAEVEYLHPDLETILKPTYGVILYQEQVMQIAQVLAGYSLGGADLLRRAMGKKKPEEMAKQREIFVTGSTERGVEEEMATHIFDLMEKFAGYGFNKSHSAAYALLAYQTAWLKAHYPAEFMAAVLSSDMDNTDKVVALVDECKSLKIEIVSPNINQSEYKFKATDEGAILYGLGAVKGVGESALADILEERKQSGPYQDLFGLCRRVSLRKVNRRVLEALIRSGSFDYSDIHRASALLSLDKAMASAEQENKNAEQGMFDMFALAEQDTEKDHREQYIECKPWSEKQLLQGEKESLGLYLSGHPLARYRKELENITTSTIAELRPSEGQVVKVAGLVVSVRTLQTKRGDRMAFIALDDGTGRIELAVFAGVYREQHAIIQKDQLLLVEGDVSFDTFSGGYRLGARQVMTIEQARSAYARGLRLRLQQSQMAEVSVPQLQNILRPHCHGRFPVWIEYTSAQAGASANFALGENWRVEPCDDLLDSLTDVLGSDQVLIDY